MRRSRTAGTEAPIVERFLGAYAPYAYALLRIVVGLLFICHGAQKIFGVFGGINGTAVPLTSLFGIAGVIELICGPLVTLGLFTGYAAFIASGEMAVAYFTGHFPNGFWPIENQGELAVLYCFIFLYIATQSSGIWSLEAALVPSPQRRPVPRPGTAPARA